MLMVNTSTGKIGMVYNYMFIYYCFTNMIQHVWRISWTPIKVMWNVTTESSALNPKYIKYQSTTYPLVNIQKTDGKILYKWPFSIAMLVYQRVSGEYLGVAIGHDDRPSSCRWWSAIGPKQRRTALFGSTELRSWWALIVIWGFP